MFGSETMKKLFLPVMIVVFLLGTYYLYPLQLGAIPFLLASIYFFYAAIKQTRLDRKRKGEKSERGQPKKNRKKIK
ncbi:hypothetical protein D9X91_17425 [Falsibacillus albus]|uniref:Uncharacterized protein n=1 Tax=Falsibacillus albus TaxID=2478915 RepID=A0A3L7JUY1_9BACI|nr:hypothetical protein D9X91_17425 [Falsibacillus albus]